MPTADGREKPKGWMPHLRAGTPSAIREVYQEITAFLKALPSFGKQWICAPKYPKIPAFPAKVYSKTPSLPAKGNQENDALVLVKTIHPLGTDILAAEVNLTVQYVSVFEMFAMNYLSSALLL
ncbi:hypothetical protein TNCV_2327441 [Trichonephila clavipes]|nr:hypothetical protein TNCV_2327441 [Trichonephila clavipes]